MIKSVNTIRGLAIDMINQANSGHPGIAMGASPMLYALYKDHMNVSVNHPNWLNRDRFVLSAGHGSSMLYALYHLLGFDLSIEDLKQFRQIKSKTPGHPEYLDVPGVEATTGPLGQGVAMAVGMALASKKLASMLNTNEIKVVDNYTYVLCGDGDLMEGISYEACSFAGKNQLDNLIMLYDSNNISLDGELSLSFDENIKLRFEAQNWHHILVEDGEDVKAISHAISEAKKVNKPVIIEVKTIIGFGSVNQGTAKVHGAPLTQEDILSVKQKYELSDVAFSVDDSVYADFQTISTNGDKNYKTWLEAINNLPEDKMQLVTRIINNEQININIEPITDELATRKSGNISLENLAKQDPLLLTGSADLSCSNLTNVKNDAQNIYYGVREFAMGAIANGIYLFAKTPIVISTFFVFSDYLKPAMRLASLMGLPINYVFTHDSVYVGEDGPTHQPVEQLATLRAMPNINVFRPADGNETMAVYKLAYEQKTTPNAICLTRQNLANITGNDINVVYNNVKKGAYVIYEPQNYTRQIIATGSELHLALAIAQELQDVRVISMPCLELFFQQDQSYQDQIIGNKDNNYVIEFGSTLIWDRFVSNHEQIIGLDRFGLSGPFKDVINHLGLDKQTIIRKFKDE